jgi:hypothetical protein
MRCDLRSEDKLIECVDDEQESDMLGEVVGQVHVNWSLCHVSRVDAKLHSLLEEGDKARMAKHF